MPNQPAPGVPTAELFAGNPRYGGGSVFARAVEGQGLLDDPPLQWQSLLFVGNKLVTHVPAEIWYTDLTVGKPVIKRLAGKENLVGSQSTAPGMCLSARFADIKGIVLRTDGSIIGAAQSGSTTNTINTIFMVTDPFDPIKCAVTTLASTASEAASWPALINDTIYFIDTIYTDDGINLIKRVETDVFFNVSTIATLPEGFYYAMIALNGKLYAVAKSFRSEGFIIEIDPVRTTDNIREIIRGGAETFGNSSTIDISGLATDGTGLFTYNGGHLLYVTLDGKVKSIAGDGTFFDFQPSYDPTQPHTAESVQLVAISRPGQIKAKVFLAFHDNAVYFSALADGEYIERIAIK